MKKFKEFYRAVLSPVTVADWKQWWEANIHSPLTDHSVDPEICNQLWELSETGIVYDCTSKASLSTRYAMYGFRDFWIGSSIRRHGHVIFAVSGRNFYGQMDAVRTRHELYQIIKEKK